DMRGLDQLAPSAKCQSVDRGDNGLRKGLNASRHLMAGSHEVHNRVCWTRFQVALKAGDIGTGTEGTSGAAASCFTSPSSRTIVTAEISVLEMILEVKVVGTG